MQHPREYSVQENAAFIVFKRMQHMRIWSSRECSIQENIVFKRMQDSREYSAQENAAYKRILCSRECSIQENTVFKRIQHSRELMKETKQCPRESCPRFTIIRSYTLGVSGYIYIQPPYIYAGVAVILFY